MPCTIRLARSDDLASINDIYNYFVVHSTCTYQEAPDSIESRRAWYERHGPAHPITVAELDGAIVGWGSLSSFHQRSAYRYTVENSVYVHQLYHRRGIGDTILGDLIARGRAIGHRTIIAAVDAGEEASIAIHAKHGFRVAGRLMEVGYKFERWLDVVYMQLQLEP
jgi:phosphinothricin acetyltransferase